MTDKELIIENWYCNILFTFVYNNYEEFQKATECSDELLSILILKHGPRAFITQTKYKYNTFYNSGERHET